MHVNDLLKIAVETGASDLHLKVGSYPMVRVRGELLPAIQSKRLDHEDLVAMSATVMSTGQRQKFRDAQEVDLAYSVPGLGRFRCNVFQQRGTIGLVFRFIPWQIRTIVVRVASSSAKSGWTCLARCTNSWTALYSVKSVRGCGALNAYVSWCG